MPFIRILLDKNESDALDKLCNLERRKPAAQAALIVSNELVRLGLLIKPELERKDELKSN